ncbi:hypothetical protein RclHR1_32620003 [Rhizophagus clarus]|uniref:Uncharacterized protein n=1 Tax=Rhizophagus clarus TaxID=94130 RepID=A0A2Z6RKA8_9GLOM|nr:hypothetical protein RclHR1_32620003 [Rhizophagus clarus]
MLCFKKKNINTTTTNSNDAKSSDAKSSEADPSKTNLNNTNSSETDLNNSNVDNMSNINSIDLTELNENNILADVHHYVVKLTGDKEIMFSDYLVLFKPEKSTGVGAQLVDLQDYKRFISDYKKLLDKNKNMVIFISLKKEKKRKQKKMSDSEELENKNIKLRKKKNLAPKLDNFSAILQEEGYIICELRDQYECSWHNSSYFVDDGRHIKLTAMHLQC